MLFAPQRRQCRQRSMEPLWRTRRSTDPAPTVPPTAPPQRPQPHSTSHLQRGGTVRRARWAPSNALLASYNRAPPPRGGRPAPKRASPHRLQLASNGAPIRRPRCPLRPPYLCPIALTISREHRQTHTLGAVVRLAGVPTRAQVPGKAATGVEPKQGRVSRHSNAAAGTALACRRREQEAPIRHQRCHLQG
jgi:hypothetical protein